MKLTRLATGIALSAMFFAGAATAQTSSFQSLRGIQAQDLTEQEMQAITGELNAYDIAAALYAKAATVTNPRLAAYLTALADKTLANAVQINAAFAKYGLLTPCTSSLCPQ